MPFIFRALRFSRNVQTWGNSKSLCKHFTRLAPIELAKCLYQKSRRINYFSPAPLQSRKNVLRQPTKTSAFELTLCKIWGNKQRVLWYFPKWAIGCITSRCWGNEPALFPVEIESSMNNRTLYKQRRNLRHAM